jgi:hypothetical protein
MMINVFGVLLILAKEDWNIFSHSFLDVGVLPITRNTISTIKKNINELTPFTQTNQYKSFLNISYIFNVNTNLHKIDNTLCKKKNYFLKISNPLWDPYQISLPNTSISKNYIELNQNLLFNTSSEPQPTTFFLHEQQVLTNLHNFNYPSINSLTYIKKKEDYIKYITDFCSLSKTNPLLAGTLALIFFSNAGVPPLAGFYGKLNIFLSAVEGSMYFLALAGVICSVIGAFYSIRLVKILYYHNISKTLLKWSRYKPISKENSIILAITLFFTLFFFFYPSFIWTLTHSAALSLCL